MQPSANGKWHRLLPSTSRNGPWKNAMQEFTKDVDTSSLRCTCGSGAHPRECSLHPENFARHIAELQAENDELLTDSERKEWRD